MTVTELDVVVPPPVRVITARRAVLPAGTPAVFQLQLNGASVSVQMLVHEVAPTGSYCSCTDVMPVLE